jgi:hypothetical protein
MLGFLKPIFSRTKTVDDFLDKDTGHLAKIGGWIGNQQFTEQEKAEMVKSVSLAVRQFSIDTAKESTQRSATRRSLAVLWVRTHLLLVVATFIAGGLDHPKFKLMWEIITSDVLTYGTMGVMLYFFGSYGYGAHMAGKKK